MATVTLDKHEVDLTKGPIFSTLIKFAIPFIFANVLTLLFHAADIATLRFMVGGDAVAAVSSTGHITNLFINFFVGFSVGASVVLSKCVGAKDINKARRVVGTAISFSIIAGAFVMIVGWFASEKILMAMGAPEELLSRSTQYVRIYLLGAPIILFYQLGAGMLRAVGDSLRPMIYLAISGVANVGLNIFFIAVCGLTVEGVAIGTVTSQLISSVLILIAMRRSKGFSRLEYKYLRIHKKELSDIVKIGLPTGLQSSLFSISNIMIQSTINSFGTVAIEGSGGCAQLDAFIYTVGNSVANAGMSIVSQSVGAKNMARVKKVILIAVATILSLQLSVGLLAYAFSNTLLSLFIESSEALVYGKQRLLVYALSYCLCGVMDMLVLSLRAMGKATISMLSTLFFVCAFRIIWLNTFYLLSPTFTMIFISYPVSWILNITAHLFLLIPLIKKLSREFALKKEQNNQTELSLA